MTTRIHLTDFQETQDQVVVIITSAQFAEMVKRRFTTSEQEERLLDFIERIKSLTLLSGDDKKLTIAIFGTSFSGLRRDTVR
jgi:nicotinamide mononucleotide adenylyltransferase